MTGRLEPGRAPAERHFLNPALLVLALGPAVAQGLGRFGYGLLLPEMRTGLSWSYTQAGFVNTVNALGYLGGALIASRVLARMDHRRAFLVAMAVIGASLLATSVATDFWLLCGLRLVTGIAGAIVFVAGGTLLAGMDEHGTSRRGFHLAVYYSGVGFGLLLVGLVLPPLLSFAAWPWGWAALGALAFPLLVVAARYSRSLHGASGAVGAGIGPVDWGRSGWLLVGYLLFGTGSIGYMTFITAALGGAGGWPAVTLFWAVFAAGAAAAPFLWEKVLDRWTSGRAFLLIVGANALGAVLPLVPLGPLATLGSAFVFALGFFTAVAVTTLHVARVAAPSARAATIGAFTMMFAAGQAIGPILTGAVSDWAGSLDAGLLLGAALVAMGAVAGSLQRR